MKQPYLAFANWYHGILSDRPIGWVVSVWFDDGAFRSLPVGTGLPPSTEEETIVALALAEAKLTLLPYDKLTPTQKVERDNRRKLT